jgi:hypothetical protein
MFPRIDEITVYRGLTQFPASFQTMQAFNQDKPFAVTAYQDRVLLTDLHDAFGDLVYDPSIERGPALGGNVDIGNRKRLALHHGH